MKSEPRFPNKLLIAGIVLILGGAVFLLWTLGLFPGFLNWFVALWPLPLMVGGIVMLYLVYLKGKAHHLLLPGMILLLGGLFFLLYNTIIPDTSFERIWPAIMSIAGLALLPYAFKSKKRTRAGLLISAAFLIVLSILFFPFSLKLIETDFVRFTSRWWPGIIVITGMVLIVSFAANKRRRKRSAAATFQHKASAPVRRPNSAAGAASPGTRASSTRKKNVPSGARKARHTRGKTRASDT
ncbi:MAG: hypothetical protein JXD23_05770 [Spirochaetales bacterium]|nr:hypothetical protein [Spirochaetales bacterium]